MPKVQELMTTAVITVAPSTPLKQVVATMLDRGISATPVVDRDGTLAGIVTEADLVAKEAYAPAHAGPASMLAAYFRGIDPQWVRKADGRTAADVMTRSVVTVAPSDSVALAARRMLSAGVKRLVVVDGANAVLGIVSRRDLLRFFAPPDDVVRRDVDAALTSPLQMPDGIDVHATVEDGLVTVTGSVLHPSDIRVVDAAMRRIPGVVDVGTAAVHAREPEPAAR
jgi:CBS domain-containing protein